MEKSLVSKKNQKLTISKFGPVELAEIELKRYNLFIGEQSIGKSTIAKLITILTDRINLIRLILEGKTAWKSLSNEYGLLPFIQNQNYNIEYFLSEKGYQYKIRITRNNVESSIAIKGENVTEPSKIVHYLLMGKPIFHKDLLYDNIIKSGQKENKGQDTMALLKDSLYIPAERNIAATISNLQPIIMLSDQLIGKQMLRFMAEMNNAKVYSAKLEIPVLGLTYIREDNEDYFVLKGRKTKWPLKIASSGIQSLLPLYIVINYALKEKEYSSYVVEEPECNLFPDKQVELLKYLFNNISNDRMTLTITTHSPYVLSAMNNFLLAGETVKALGNNSENEIRKISKDIPILSIEDCSVYSLGPKINGGDYCKNIVDEDSGMIDANTLDQISYKLGEEFDKIDKLLISKEGK